MENLCGDLRGSLQFGASQLGRSSHTWSLLLFTFEFVFMFAFVICIVVHNMELSCLIIVAKIVKVLVSMIFVCRFLLLGQIVIFAKCLIGSIFEVQFQ